MDDLDMNITIFDDKAQQMFRDLTRYSRETQLGGGNFKVVLADAVKAMKRLAARSEALSGEWERVEFAQRRGPTIEATARMLAHHGFRTHGNDPMKVEFEIWETRGEALIAVTITSPVDREGLELVDVAVIQKQEDAQAMRLAIMDHFDWNDGARSMARKLGWSLRVEVE